MVSPSGTLASLLGAILLGSAAASSAQSSDSPAAKPGRGAYAEINGIRMYYESHGPESGVPLVLLHGGGSTLEVTFGRILPHLAHRRVIAIEEQAHGRTSDRNQPLSFEASADDVATLLQQLRIEQADLFGFSNGASTALQTAIRHPRRVRKLIFASAMTRKDGAHAELWTFIAQAKLANMPQPLKDAFLKVNPDPAKLEVMHDKDAERMRNFKDVPDADLRSMRAPTLVLVGDHDIVKPEHAVELTHLIPNARLLILIGGHGDYLGEATAPQQSTRAPLLTAGFIEEFLDAPAAHDPK
jgi:pimeloyl-ACP methyl ester carboxylesterase